MDRRPPNLALRQTAIDGPQRRAKIMIVDDPRDVREAMFLMLRDEGYECRKSENGQDAVEQLGDYAADLILLDWCMPVTGGAEFLKVRKLLPNLKDIPVIVISATPNVMICARGVSASIAFRSRWIIRAY